MMPKTKLVVWNGILHASYSHDSAKKYSNILEKVGSKLIGRYDWTRFSDFPGFGIVIITAHFH